MEGSPMRTALYCSLVAACMALPGCGYDGNEVTEVGDDVAVAEQPLWDGEVIERNDNGSQQTAYYMYTLDTQDANICGWTGTPDYILHYSRAGAYANQDKLRMDGENYPARCFLNLNPSGLSARVYDNNHVMVCVGKTRVDLCAGGNPTLLFDGLRLWQVP